MKPTERAIRVTSFLQRLSSPEAVLSRYDTERALESIPGAPAQADLARSALQKLSLGQELTPPEADVLEAIVLPKERPVVFVRKGTYSISDELWGHFGNAQIRPRVENAISAIGRIDLPSSATIPFGGTGFVVGPDLVMTNRHVAELFTHGLGTRNLRFKPGEDAAVDFKREHSSQETLSFRVLEVRMIHPYWDMAILKVAGIPATIRPLRLATAHPDDLKGREVAVVGYPARDWRNDSHVQHDVFGGVYNVKRLQPGKIRTRQPWRSFGKDVSAMTHDASTLGGNSGSALVDVSTGEVVGLHFAGVYLKDNFAVPTYELARDSRVVDCGVNFQGRVAPTTDWATFWTAADSDDERRPAVAPPASTAPGEQPTFTFTVPLVITVTVGQATVTTGVPQSGSPTRDGQLEKVPVIFPDLGSRRGYQGDFLELTGGLEVPLPRLTGAGHAVAARLEDGEPNLKYHKFTVVMHKRRRLALFTAANVDWRDTSRKIDGHKPTRKQLNGFTGNEREDWVTDPRIPFDHQLPDFFFTRDGGAFDRGHLVRRDDVAWGPSFEDMQRGNGDTFHTTNCSPQTADFNQANRTEFNWGALEDLVEKRTRAEKVCVISGPVLADDDRFFHGFVKSGVGVSVQIPRSFWKIVVANVNGRPAAFGFLLEQSLAGVNLHDELIVPEDWKRFMRPIAEIEARLNGLALLSEYREWDQFEA